MKVIAIANQKGGVGKTTTAVNLAACLARAGRRTLLVDLDHQTNATDHLGVEPPEDERLSSWALLCERPVHLKPLLRPVSPNLVLIPGHIALAGIDLDLANEVARDLRLRNALAGASGDYDYCVIDCPPALNASVINALSAADRVIITIQTNRWALQAVRRLLKVVATVREEINPCLGFYALATLHRANVVIHREVLEMMRAHFQELGLDQTVRHTATLAEAAANNQSIVDYAEGSKAHLDYLHVTEEIVARMEGGRGVQEAPQAIRS